MPRMFRRSRTSPSPVRGSQTPKPTFTKRSLAGLSSAVRSTRDPSLAGQSLAAPCPTTLTPMVLIFALGALTILPLGGCSDDGTGPEDQEVVFPLQVGNTWTYAADNPQLADPLEWVVTDRKGDTVTLVRAQGDAYTGPLTLIDDQDAIQIIPDHGAPQPLYRFQPGASWVRHDPWDCDAESQWIAIKETEAIQTPAGTFHNTLRLERRSTATCADAGTMFEWWAPGVGLVRWEELNFWNQGTLVFELVEYAGHS